jgi:hypothetical protein
MILPRLAVASQAFSVRTGCQFDRALAQRELYFGV